MTHVIKPPNRDRNNPFVTVFRRIAALMSSTKRQKVNIAIGRAAILTFHRNVRGVQIFVLQLGQRPESTKSLTRMWASHSGQAIGFALTMTRFINAVLHL